MSNRRTLVLASIVVLLMAGFYSQAIAVNEQACCTISSRVPSNPHYDYQSAVADNDSEDSSDDLVALQGTLNLLPSATTVGLSQGHSTIIGPPRRSTGATLASQHILLRL